MDQAFLNQVYQAHQSCTDCPPTEKIASFFKDLLAVLFPGFASNPLKSEAVVRDQLMLLRNQLVDLLPQEEPSKSVEIADRFFNTIPAIYAKLHKDVEAIHAGDPAAKSREEVIRSYPGFMAIAAYRIAHELYVLKVNILPRSITEYSHSVTGIDIHPGARIGERFCIDHGTGVVIGETTHIGDDVKIYQGVTLGALSVSKDLKDSKRHPTIGNQVIIYSGATILGGDTLVGDESVIGGNVWLTKSVPSRSRVYYQPIVQNERSKTPESIIVQNV